MPNETVASVSYDAANRPISLSVGGVAFVELVYNSDGLAATVTLNGVKHKLAYSIRAISILPKTVDGLPTEARVTQLVSIATPETDTVRFSYDKAGYLSSVKQGAFSETFEVEHETPADRNANLLAKEGKSGANDGANQLVTSDHEGVRTVYEYDAAGRLVREGERTYHYGYLDKVLSVTEKSKAYAYTYSPDGQLARADYGNGETEDFIWDGLALIKRGSEQLMNEPHAGGGAPILSSAGTSYFNDQLGTSLGEKAKGHKYLAASQTAFGEGDAAYFTGKPLVSGLGRAFLFRNYRPDLAKWQTVDPFGYPDGWNQLKYCGNRLFCTIDLYGAITITICSDAEGAASSSNIGGHSWIVITDDNGNQTTYGTWGNNPNGLGNGLHENLENGRNPDASRTRTISQDKKGVFDKIIDEYRGKGADVWSLTNPCSDFAADVWNRVTGEDLSSRWFWDTPSDLRDAIIDINGNVNHKVVE